MTARGRGGDRRMMCCERFMWDWERWRVGAAEQEYLIGILSMHWGHSVFPVHMCPVNDRSHRLITVIWPISKLSRRREENIIKYSMSSLRWRVAFRMNLFLHLFLIYFKFLEVLMSPVHSRNCKTLCLGAFLCLVVFCFALGLQPLFHSAHITLSFKPSGVSLLIS